jgi:adenylate cyclase class 2
MIEAELKARVKDVEAVRTWLRARAEEEEATYHDTYYDWPDRRLETKGQEIRLRTITASAGISHVLTYKQPPVDRESGSKPEYETTIADRAPVAAMLCDLGLVELVTLTKHCLNFKFDYGNRQILATLVTVPELSGAFLEVETRTESAEINVALKTVKAVMADIEVIRDLSSDSYTKSVMGATEARNLMLAKDLC